MAVPSCAAMDTAIKDVTLRRKEYLLPNVRLLANVNMPMTER